MNSRVIVIIPKPHPDLRPWLVLAGAVAAIDVLAFKGYGRTLSSGAGNTARRNIGAQLTLWAMWVALGFHLFKCPFRLLKRTLS